MLLNRKDYRIKDMLGLCFRIAPAHMTIMALVAVI